MIILKCKVIRITFDIGLKTPAIIEDTINAWLKDNPDVEIRFLSSAGIGNKTLFTTILYDE